MFFEIIQSALSLANNTFMSITGWVNSVTGGNEWMAGIVLAGIGGAVTWCIYKLTLVKSFFMRRCTVNASVDSATNGFVFMRVREELSKYSSSLGTRDFEIIFRQNYDECTRGVTTTPGLGIHYFFIGLRPFWYTVIDMPSDGTNEQKKRLNISTVGFTSAPLDNLLSEWLEHYDGSEIEVQKTSPTGALGEVNFVSLPELKSLTLNQPVKDALFKFTTDFLEGADTCKELGIPHKAVGVLQGEPGSGKTTVLSALAREAGARSVNIIDLETLKDNSALELAMNDIQRNAKGAKSISFVILEDVHSCSSLLKQEYREGIKPSSVTLSGVLNVLNGIVPLNNIMVMMTTNYIDRLEPALLRPGRVDAVMELPRINPETVAEFIGKIDPSINEEFKFTKPIRGCDIYQLTSGTFLKSERIIANAKYIEENLPQSQVYGYEDSNKLEFK